MFLGTILKLKANSYTANKDILLSFAIKFQKYSSFLQNCTKGEIKEIHFALRVDFFPLPFETFRFRTKNILDKAESCILLFISLNAL